MRWPFTSWLRGAAGGEDASPGAPGTAMPGTSTSDTDDAAGPAPAGEARPAAWRELSPVQRAIGETPVTAPSAAFARGLAGRRVPDPMLAPLAHDMTADGPAGLVSGIAVPLVQRLPSGADVRVTPGLPAAAAADRARSRARGTVTTIAARPPMADGEGATDDASHDGAPAGPGDVTAAGQPESELPTVAPRALPVARLATPVPAIAATRVAEATAPAPIVAHAQPVAPEAAVGAVAALAAPEPAVTAPVIAELPAATTGTGATGSAGSSVGEPAAETGPARSGADAERGPVVVGRRSLGESRRLGLGAPLAGPPPSAVRGGGNADMPVARRAFPSAEPSSASQPAAPAPPVVAAAGTAAALPRLVVARRAVTLPGPGSAPGSIDPGSTTDRSQATPAAIAAGPSPAGGPGDTVETTGPASPGSEPTADGSGSPRPLVGELPLSVSRRTPADAPADADAGDAGAVGTAPLALAGLPRAPIADSVGEAGTDRDVASTIVAPVQRSWAADSAAGPPQPAGGQPALRDTRATVPMVAGRSMRADVSRPAFPLAHVPPADPAPVPGRFGIPAPAVPGGGPRTAPATAWDGDRPAAQSGPATAVQREERTTAARAAPFAGRGSASTTAEALPLMRSSVGAAAPAGFPAALAAAGSDDAVGWSPAAGFTSVARQPGPFVQRAAQIDELTVTPAGQGAGGAGATAAGSAAGPAGSTGAGGEDTDYEELAEQVYDKIRARLVTELLLDRERAGMLVDW